MAEWASIHDYALDGDEGWQVGDVVNLSDHGLDAEDRLWRITKRDSVLGYWHMEPENG